jgi:hypothetical protein
MKMKNLAAFLLVPLFVVAFSFNPAYSKVSSEEPSLLEKVRKAEQTMEKHYPRKSIEDPLYEKLLVTVEQCSEHYEECIEKCADQEKGYDTCEDKCREDLSPCEKDLPVYLKTMK